MSLLAVPSVEGSVADIGDGRPITPLPRRPTLDCEQEDDIYYSPKYNDDVYEYRHVSVPKPIGRLLEEWEWRGLGIKQSPGWVHYMIHNPEPHILLFRREKDFQLKYPNATIKLGGLVG
eukprot:jgi/Hompol1/1916/HPOL_002795-RA